MEVHLQIPSSPTTDLTFHGSPSTTNWLYCLSAPTSPSRSSDFYRDIETDEFAFQVSKEATTCTVSAADLFDDGKIRLLSSPLSYTSGDRHQEVETTTYTTTPVLSSSRSPKSTKSKENVNSSKVRKTFWSVFTPKRDKKTDPHALDDDNHGGRGRSLTTSSSIRGGTRSLSPNRLPGYPVWQDDDEEAHKKKKESMTSKSSRMLKLKNFLLFRSASEGRAADKLDPSKKFAAFYRRQNESHHQVSSSSSKISRAHQRHSAVKKAALEDLKKKTFLPYKPRILGL